MSVSLTKTPFPRYASCALVNVIANKQDVAEAEELAGIAIDACILGSIHSNPNGNTLLAIAEYRAAVAYCRERLIVPASYIVVEA